MHADSPLKKVFATANGVVYKCSCCDSFQVSLGNALLATHADGIKRLLAVIDGMGASGDAGRSDRRYTFRPDDRPYAYAFNYDELQELKQLLEGAQAMQALKAMVEATTGVPNTIC
ncbi:MAG: hypothetical protein AAGJ10_08325 [Bacteroidota bacterium]